MLAQINGMYEGDPAHRAMIARFAFAKLEPAHAAARLGRAARTSPPTTPCCATS